MDIYLGTSPTFSFRLFLFYARSSTELRWSLTCQDDLYHTNVSIPLDTFFFCIFEGLCKSPRRSFLIALFHAVPHCFVLHALIFFFFFLFAAIVLITPSSMTAWLKWQIVGVHLRMNMFFVVLFFSLLSSIFLFMYYLHVSFNFYRPILQSFINQCLRQKFLTETGILRSLLFFDSFASIGFASTLNMVSSQSILINFHNVTQVFPNATTFMKSAEIQKRLN